LKYAENSRTVVAAVQSGRAKLGIIFQSDLRQSGTLRTLLNIPLSAASTTYGAGLLASTKKPEARALLEYLGSAASQATWTQHGFAAAGTTKAKPAKAARGK
jgi:ABC-type molybdate transport system substrate-binding protein